MADLTAENPRIDACAIIADEQAKITEERRANREEDALRCRQNSEKADRALKELGRLRALLGEIQEYDIVRNLLAKQPFCHLCEKAVSEPDVWSVVLHTKAVLPVRLWNLDFSCRLWNREVPNVVYSLNGVPEALIDDMAKIANSEDLLRRIVRTTTA